MAKKKVAETAHALLSASGASRWINCPPSARLEEKFGINTSSIYADEGTLAHELGEVNLRILNDTIPLDEYQERINDIESNALYNAEMPDEVEKYTSYVFEEYLEARKVTKDAVLNVEQKFSLEDIIPGGFGTNDASIVADVKLKIYDLKYGKGVKVSAINNSQLKLYAWGALKEYELLYDIQVVELNIVQPRLDNFSSWEITVEDLKEWVDSVVIPAAKLADAGKGVLKAGDHCKFCKIKRRCKALANTNLEIAKYEFKSPELLTELEIADILKRESLFVNWINSISDYALEQALDGKKWPGFKVVAGRGSRKWLDSEKVKEALLAKGFKDDDLTDSKLKGITAIEKLVTKKNFNEYVGEWVIKQEGKPTLVDSEDKRPELGSAVNDFQ